MISTSEIKNSKIALVYRGYYYRPPGEKSGNYFKCHKNHVDNIISVFDNIDIYYHTYTYSENMDNELYKLLKPKQCIIQSRPPTRYSNSKLTSLVNTFSVANSLVNGRDYDLIINTRFDLVFSSPVCNWNILTDYFNVLGPELVTAWGHESNTHNVVDPLIDWNIERKTSDIFFAYPGIYHESFTRATDKLLELDMYRKRRMKGFMFGERIPIGWPHWLYREVSYLLPNNENDMHLIHTDAHPSGGVWLSDQTRGVYKEIGNPLAKISREV